MTILHFFIVANTDKHLSVLIFIIKLNVFL